MLFVLFYRSIVRFSVGPKGVEFEMSTEHRQALFYPNSSAERRRSKKFALGRNRAKGKI
jgi:hypothetical protein